jgi:hypothetical protein
MSHNCPLPWLVSRQPFRYAPERPTTGKVRVARDSGVKRCTVICQTQHLLEVLKAKFSQSKSEGRNRLVV